MKKMKKQFAVAMAAIVLLSALMVPLVMSENGNTTDLNKTNKDSTAKYVYERGWIISTTIANETNISELELPIGIAATSDLVGKIVFASDREGNIEIYMMDADGTNVKKLTNNTARDDHPAWSPDCKRIAFASDRDGDPEIYVMNADGTNVKKLTSNIAIDCGPDWSPDRKKIVFAANGEGNFEIYIMDADGTNVKKLTSNTADDACSAWSPDGKKIAFTSDRDGDPEIYVMDADGTNVTTLTNNTIIDDHPAWSPDGKKIAFTSDRDKDPRNLEICVMDADGTNVEKLTKTVSYIVNQFPAWSPDGKKIAFTSDKDGDMEICVMDADGTNVVKLTRNTAGDQHPDWRFVPVEQVEFELESIKVFTEMVFDVSPFDVPTEGYILLAIDASVITPVDTHNAEVEIQLWDKNNVTEYDRDVSYLGETIANKEKSFRVVLYHDQPIAWEDSSTKWIFRSDDLTTPLTPLQPS